MNADIEAMYVNYMILHYTHTVMKTHISEEYIEDETSLVKYVDMTKQGTKKH